MSKKKILLVDDDDDDRELFALAVEEVSPETTCLCLSSASEALSQLKSNSDLPDVIFLDLNMPVMNGHQFLVQAKQENSLRDIPIIIFSTSSDIPTVEKSLKLGASDFISKPSNFNELLKILQPILAS